MSKGRKLKLAFAMGGGVSLGTFSGAALTEAIKQLIVYGVYKNDNEFHYYDDIEIDVMSGASAGAMSLGIMIRVFTDYNDILHLLNQENESNESTLERLRQQLAEQFIGRYDLLSPTQQANLLAAQVAQEIQRYVWCNQVSIESLAGISTENQRDLTPVNSILDRGWLEAISRKTILPRQNISIASEGLLASRVLFACTLTRLEGQELSAPLDEKVIENDLYRKLYETVMQDATVSTTHKDLRVFDINIIKEKNAKTVDANSSGDRFPTRWLLAYSDAVQQDLAIDLQSPQRKTFRLEEANFWSHIAATAIAAGTFPFAFEPSRLTRYKQELTENEKNEYDKIFTYVDGGTLNNEPISEAFRLAAFLDSEGTGAIGDDFDRYVFFVDPFISMSEDIHQASYNREYRMKDSKIKQIPGVNKLFKFTPIMVSVLRSEGAISELTKSVAVLDRFNKRDDLKKFYSETIDRGLKKNVSEFSKDEIKDILSQKKILIENLKDGIKKQYGRQMIPVPSLSLNTEIRRIILDPENKDYFEDVLDYFREPIEKSPIYDDYNKFFKNESLEDIKYFNIWLKSLYFAYIELALDLSDKNKKAKMIPIGPLKFEGDTFKQISLEGQRVAGFYGFFHKNIRERDFEKGTISAKNVLSKLGFLGDEVYYDESGEIMIENPELEKVQIIESIKKVFMTRVVDQSLGAILNEPEMFAFKLLFDEKDRIKHLAEDLAADPDAKQYQVELRFKVPRKGLQIAKITNGADIDTLQIRDFWYLVYIAKVAKSKSNVNNYEWETGDKNQHIDSNQFKIVDEKGVFPDKHYCNVSLPDLELLKKAIVEYPNPVFEIDLSSDAATLQQRLDAKTISWQVRNAIEPLEISIANPV